MAEPVDPHRGQPVLAAGAAPGEARAAMILMHGRGASAEDILGVAGAIGRGDVLYLAPQAAGHVWYPQSFVRPRTENEAWLASAHGVIRGLFESLALQGLPPEKVVLSGFSQGACLSLDFAAHHPRRFGGIVAFAGAMIGERVAASDYSGSLAGTPLFIGCGDRDPFFPPDRVAQSAEAMRALGAKVDLRMYPGLTHSINDDEIAAARTILDGAVAADVPGKP